MVHAGSRDRETHQLEQGDGSIPDERLREHQCGNRHRRL